MPFTNPILGGTTLVRPAIKSPNYVAGTSGWSINQDGTVEFNAGTFRGVILIGNPTASNVTIGPGSVVKIFDSSGNLIVQLSPNNISVGINLNATAVTGFSNGSILLNPQPTFEMVPQAWQSNVYFPAFLTMDSSGNTQATATVGLQIWSPWDSTQSGSQASMIALYPRSHDGTSFKSVIVLSSDFVRATGPIYATGSGAQLIEPWHNLTLSNGFSNRGVGFPPLSYRQVASPPNSVQITGQIVSGATTTGGTVIATLPFGTTTEIGITCINANTNACMALNCETNGQLKLFGTWVNGNIININGIVPLDL